MPNPYFNNQRTFIPNTLIKSEEANAQFNDVENGFDLIDEMVTQIDDRLDVVADQVTNNTNQINQIISGEIPVGGGSGTGGGAGDPNFNSELPIGGFAYLDSRVATPGNHVTLTEPTALSADQYPVLSQFIPPKTDFLSNIAKQVVNFPEEIVTNGLSRSFVGDSLFGVITPDLFADTELAVFAKRNGTWVYVKKFILPYRVHFAPNAGFPPNPAAESTQPIGSQYTNIFVMESRFNFIVVQARGQKYLRSASSLSTDPDNDTKDLILVYQLVGDELTLVASFSPQADYRNYLTYRYGNNPFGYLNARPGLSDAVITDTGQLYILDQDLCTNTPDTTVPDASKNYAFGAVYSIPLLPIADFYDPVVVANTPGLALDIRYFEFAEIPPTIGFSRYANGVAVFYRTNGFSVNGAQQGGTPTLILYSPATLTSPDLSASFSLDPAELDQIGQVTLAGNSTHAFVGADSFGNRDEGAVFVYNKTGRVQTINSVTNFSNDLFGDAVDANQNLLVVSAGGGDFEFNDSFLFELVGEQYVLKASYVSRSTTQFDSFGFHAVDGGMVELNFTQQYVVVYERFTNSIGVTPLPPLQDKKTILRVR